jgi:hypothetical protein
MGIKDAPWTMHHAPLNRFKEIQLRVWIRPFHLYHQVDILGTQELVRMLQENEHVHVREFALFKLDGVEKCGTFQTVHRRSPPIAGWP